MLLVTVRWMPGTRVRRFVMNSYMCSLDLKSAEAKTSKLPVEMPRKKISGNWASVSAARSMRGGSTWISMMA